MDKWEIQPPARPPLQGDEKFLGLNATVEDFWRFAIPDLRVNNVRGWLAEFLVWRALDVERPVRIEWDQFDVLWEGVRIEVKSSGHLQNWGQKRLSSLLFTDLATRAWPLNTSKAAAEANYNADVYVFCAHMARAHDEYDPLDLRHWHVAVLPITELRRIGQKSLSWAKVIDAAGAESTWTTLKDDVRAAASLVTAESLPDRPVTETPLP